MKKIWTQAPPLGRQINRSHPLAQGLVGCWLLNESGGTHARDSTGKCPIDGIMTGTNKATFKTAQRGPCANFVYDASGSTGSYIDLGSQNTIQNTTGGQYTISAWVYMNTVSGIYHYIFNDFDSGGNTASVILYLQNTTHFGFFRNGGSGGAISATTPVVNAWYHIVGVCSGATGAWNTFIYINGKQDGSSSTATNGTTHQMSIGRPGSYTGGLTMDGYIQNVQLWNRPLTVTEVRSLYTNSYQMFL